jgi:hypothetical protein
MRKSIAGFGEAVERIFSPLAERHGQTLVAESPTDFAIPMEKLTIRIRYVPSHRPDVAVMTFSNDPTWLSRSPLRTWGIHLMNFVRDRNPVFDSSLPTLQPGAPIGDKLALLADLLEQYGAPLLHDDADAWAKVAERVEAEFHRGLQPENSKT